MKKFTINDIRSWKPCYDPTRYLAESWEGTALDILNDNRIPFKDRLWVIMRTDLVSERLMRRFAVWCVRQVQHLMTDQRSLHALDVAEAYAENRWLIDDAEYVRTWENKLAAAEAAANDAIEGAAAWTVEQVTAWYAARNAAWDAASDAAKDAALNAAAAAEWSVAWNAAWDAAAARVAARAAAEAAQEQKLREMLIAGVETGDTK